MSEDEFTRLFKYIEGFRKEVNEKLEQTASQKSLDRLTNTIDSFSSSGSTTKKQIAWHEIGNLTAW